MRAGLDIVPIKDKYLGMGRSLIAADLLTKKSKAVYDNLLDKYFSYLDNWIESIVNEEKLNDNGLCKKAEE